MARRDETQTESDPNLRALARRLGLVGRTDHVVRSTWTVVTQSVHPEQPWVLLDSFRDRDVAADALADLRPEDGTLAVILKGPTPWWLGVGVGRAVVPSPPRPGAPPLATGATAWIGAWEGAEADAPTMLSFARGCAPSMPVLAACACAAIAVERLSPGFAAVDALDRARRWAARGAVAAADLAAGRSAAAAAGDRMRQGSRVRSANYAAVYACDAAYGAAIGGAWNGSCQSAVLAAEIATGGGRKFAAIVRRYVSLGSALAGLLDEE